MSRHRMLGQLGPGLHQPAELIARHAEVATCVSIEALHHLLPSEVQRLGLVRARHASPFIVVVTPFLLDPCNTVHGPALEAGTPWPTCAGNAGWSARRRWPRRRLGTVAANRTLHTRVGESTWAALGAVAARRGTSVEALVSQAVDALAAEGREVLAAIPAAPAGGAPIGPVGPVGAGAPSNGAPAR